ncbi:MAG: hypothetical protein EHM62_03460 [Methylococcus sp.]|nr:MAG: hypothetical protein EHM62_03460 [Methylococcus sp.]
MPYWRGFSNTILHWRTDDLMVAMAYDVGTEKRDVGGLQSLWMGSAVWTRWHIAGPWSVALRPEVYWDPDGELNGSKQLITAITSPAEYQLPLEPSNAALRLEFRHDTSNCPQGGLLQPRSHRSSVGTRTKPDLHGPDLDHRRHTLVGAGLPGALRKMVFVALPLGAAIAIADKNPGRQRDQQPCEPVAFKTEGVAEVGILKNRKGEEKH